MIDLSQARMTTLVAHLVGNKLKSEGYHASDSLLELNDDNLTVVLQEYFLKSFKAEEYFRFTDPFVNEVYERCHRIFEGSLADEFLPNSKDLLQHLYMCAMHPHIKGGEFYVAHFREIVLDGLTVEAIGLFKSENKDFYLQLDHPTLDRINLTLQRGVPVNKLDKGCLIFNTQAEDGYTVMMVDRNSEDTAYWRDDFLGLQRLQDHSFQTSHFLQMVDDFADEVLAQEKDKKDQLVFLNRAINYFDRKKEFDLDEFKSNVVEPQHRQRFDEYRVDYEQDTQLPDSEYGFEISKFAVRQMKKHFKSEMVLDTQIRIQLLTKNASEAAQYIERGFDEERNMYFYKTYFNAEQL